MTATHAQRREAARAAEAAAQRGAAARWFIPGLHGRPAVCAYEHRRRPAPAVFLVGPVPGARELLACGDHVAVAIRHLAGLVPGGALTRAVAVKVLEPGR